MCDADRTIMNKKALGYGHLVLPKVLPFNVKDVKSTRDRMSTLSYTYEKLSTSNMVYIVCHLLKLKMEVSWPSKRL